MQLGPYTIIDRLGIGGSGEILRAYQNTDPKKEVVVLKRLLHKLKNDPVAQEYFETEADLGRQLVHPNLVRQLRVGLHEDELFLVLEYIDGPDLSALLKKTRVLGLTFPVTLGLYILQQILDGLHYAHELQSSDGDNLNLVHRDVNPHNVLLSQDGRVLLADFGVARLQSLEGGRPEDMAYGKLGYISPEQLHNRPIDRRTDIFALGVLAYEIFVGLHPFVKPDDNDDQVTKRILENDYPPIALAYPELQKPIADLLIKALETKTKKRFQTALEMRDRISDFIPPHFNGPDTLQKTIKKLFS